ncbi:MAG: polysaccharide biosynthesis/export family protein, partial [Pirellulaceae bacterium]
MFHSLHSADCGSPAPVHSGLCRLALGLVILLTAGLGCSTSGGTFTIFPTGHFLLGSTKYVASATPSPAMAPRELDRTVLADYYVEPGDVLLLEPTSLDSPIRFPGDQTVLADGTIDLGRYGRLVVAGRTIEQIEGMVQQTVEAQEGDVDPINVRLISPEGTVYYVLGEVNSPGSFPLIGRETDRKS